MEYTKTLSCMKLYVGYAFILAMSPIRFDNSNKTLVISNSTAYVIRHAITMFCMVSYRAAVIAFLLRDIMNHNIGLEDKFDILQIAITLISVYCLINYIHNYWTSPEIVATLNSFLLFYNGFQRKHA
jgi:hypothetical protein